MAIYILWLHMDKPLTIHRDDPGRSHLHLVEDVEAALVEVSFAHLAAHVERLQADAVVDACDRRCMWAL